MQLDLYLPDGIPRAPLVVFVHGGEWRWGSRDRAPAGVLLGAGFALASISYRLSHQASFPAQIHDCKAAIRWLRANSAQFGYDATRIGAWGVSAGGHLVSLLGTTANVRELEGDLGNVEQSSAVQAVVDFYGPADLTELDGSADSPGSQLIGGEIRTYPEKAVQASPVTYVAGDAAPFFIVHGEGDPSVPVRQSELLANRLRGAGVAVEFHKLAGAGHGGPEFRSTELRRAIVRFLTQYLLSGLGVFGL